MNYFSLISEKKTFFLTLAKHVLRIQMAQRKFSTSIAREPPPTLPDPPDEFKFASLGLFQLPVKFVGGMPAYDRDLCHE